MKNLLDVKKHSTAMMKLIAQVQLKEHGVECYFENAATAITMQVARSEVLEAFKKDISKTADDLVKAQAIINTIKNGKVVEFDSIYNTVEEVFGSCYDATSNTITISGVTFIAASSNGYVKSDFQRIILESLFGIDKKELSGVLKALVKYEEAKTDIQKALLYPSTVLADEIIKKIADEDIKFESFRKQQSFEERAEFDVTFKRTGVTGVIQNSTYIDADGIKQLASSHKRKDAVELEKLLSSGSLKYIGAVEVDSDGSLEKMTYLVQQIEKLTLNTSVKFTLKARKLGNLKARGVFFPNQLIVAEDVRDTSAIIHEIAHLIHLKTLEENSFVNYMIEKLTPMIEFYDEITPSKVAYYKTPTEVVARACEIAALFAQEEGRFAIEDKEFDVIKSREFYAQQKGIYFNFTDFDEKTKEEFLALFELFYETSADEVVEGRYDNFIKIDTRYKRVEKKLDFYSLMKKEAQRANREKKALYSLVNSQNIKLIYENRGDVSIEELSKTILVNISYCGNHKERMTVPEWLEVIEDKSGVINFILRQVQNTLSKKEWIFFLHDLKSKAWKDITKEIFFGGFTDKFKRALRAEFRENETPQHDELKEFKESYILKNIGSLLGEELLRDEDFVKQVLEIEPSAIKHLNSSYISKEKLIELNTLVLKDEKKFLGTLIHPDLCDNEEFMKIVVAKEKRAMAYTVELRNNKRFMSWFFEQYGYEASLSYMGGKLKNDEVFAKPIIEDSNKYLEFFSKRVQTHPSIAAMYDEEEMELKKLEGAKASFRRKIARETKSMKVLEVLSKDKNYEVRAAVAKNSSTAVGTLLNLAKLKNEWVKQALAENPNTPKSVLDKLIKENDEYILASLAVNPSLTKQKLLRISQFEHRWVKWCVLKNQNIQEFAFDVKIHREIVSNCVRGEEEYFYYELKNASAFRGSYKFFDDIANNIEHYNLIGGYEAAFIEMATKIIEHNFTTPQQKKKTETKIEVKKVEEKKPEVQTEETDSDFEALIVSGEIIDFERTDGKGVEKVLRIEAKIDDFKSFNQYMRSNKMGYYSRFAKGFILYKEYAQKLLEKSGGQAKAASVATALYSADMLQNFANGTLF